MRQLCELQRNAPHLALRSGAREFLYDWYAIMRVLAQPQMPLTNNAAERQLRHWVIARRISYGTRAMEGSNSFALLSSVMDTCRLRGASVTNTLAQPFMPHARDGQLLPCRLFHLRCTRTSLRCCAIEMEAKRLHLIGI